MPQPSTAGARSRTTFVAGCETLDTFRCAVRSTTPPPKDLCLDLDRRGYSPSVTATSLRHRTSRQLLAAHPAIVRLGRLGWLAKGMVYVLAGILAAAVAARSVGWNSSVAPDGEASPTGAIKEIATFTGGRLLLLALAFGLVLYALWRLFTAFAPGGSGAEAVATRIGYGVSAILYLTFSLTALALARRPTANADGNKKVVDLSAQVMSHSVGRWAIALAGLIAIGAGIYRIVKGLKGDVETELNLAGLEAVVFEPDLDEVRLAIDEQPKVRRHFYLQAGMGPEAGGGLKPIDGVAAPKAVVAGQAHGVVILLFSVGGERRQQRQYLGAGAASTMMRTQTIAQRLVEVGGRVVVVTREQLLHFGELGLATTGHEIDEVGEVNGRHWLGVSW